MNINTCPICGTKLQKLQTIWICEKAHKFLNDAELFSYLAKVPLDIAKEVVQEWSDIDVRPSDVVALAYGVPGKVINVWRDDKLLYDFPTVFPNIPNEGNIIIIDDPSLLVQSRPEIISVPGQIITNWLSLFKDRKVTFLYSKNEQQTKLNASSLRLFAKEVLLGKYLENIDESVKKATTVYGGSRIVETEINKENMSLKDLIQSYHYVASGNGSGVVYRPSLTVPVEQVVNDVIDWFIVNGAKFLWDNSQAKGYIIYKDKPYALDKNDANFRSLLFHLGGVTYATNEGRNIIEGLSAAREISVIVEPVPWLTNSRKEIVINQGTTDLIVNLEEVKVIPTNTFTYAMLQPTNFKPIEIVEIEDMQKSLTKLFSHCADFFAVSQIAKEIIICWLLGIFMLDLSPIRPGLRIRGFAGTGKSTILKLIYWLFYGDPQSRLPKYTLAALWRRSTIDPLIIIDNENVEQNMDEQLRTFFDLAATGGERHLGVSNTGIDTKKQTAHSLVLMSGLDAFIHADVLTRYFEVVTGFEYQKSFYEIEEKENLLDARNEIWSAVFQMFKNDILPNLRNFMTRQNNERVKNLLDTKERTADYFLFMVAIGKSLQKYNVIPEGNIEARWTEYLRDTAMQTAQRNALSIEWVKNFKIAITQANDAETVKIEAGQIETVNKFNFVEKNGLKIGLKGTLEEILNALAWAAKVLARRLPWHTAKALLDKVNDDLPAWKEIGWEWNKYEDREKRVYEILWGSGI